MMALKLLSFQHKYSSMDYNGFISSIFLNHISRFDANTKDPNYRQKR